MKMKSWCSALTLAAVLGAGTAFAAAPVSTGEDCDSSEDPTKSCTDHSKYGEHVYCDTKGNVSGSTCNAALGLCKCFYVGAAGCLNDSQCVTGQFCNGQYECEANTQAGSGGGTSGGCAAVPGGPLAYFAAGVLTLLRARSKKGVRS